MKKGLKKVIAVASAVTMLGGTVGAIVACNPKEEDNGKRTYNTYTTVLPSNWNMMTYQDDNDTAILDYISSSMFTYDYKFDDSKGGKYTADGKVNAAAIVHGEYSTDFDAATAIKDVTATVDAKWGYTAAQKAAGGYAYQITIRDDLKWDDGKAINVDDFIYSMQQQLDPQFLNYRANSYYSSIQIINAKNYFYNGTYAAENLIVDTLDVEYRPMSAFTKDAETGRLSITENGQKYDIVFKPSDGGSWDPDNGMNVYYNYYFKPYGSIAYYFGYYDEPDADDYKDEDGNWLEGGEEEFAADHAEWEGDKDDLEALMDAVEQSGSDAAWQAYAEEIVPAVQTEGDAIGYVYMTEDYADIIAHMIANLQGYLTVDEYAEDAKDVYYDANDATKTISYAEVEWQEFCFKARKWAELDYSEVGYYKVDDYNFVVCLDSPIALLKDDGSLSWQSAYYMSSFPLVHKDKYEASKKEPQAGSTLWTSTYNSSVATTASWGPYKLTDFQSGKSYRLEKNEYWYGWNMDQYKDQFQVDAIECELVDGSSTAWLGFLAGDFDVAGIDVNHADYANSKYANYAPGSGTYFFQVYGNLNVLASQNNPNNNGILAIDEFRQALSLALDREDYGAKTAVASLSNYGIINGEYWSDIDAEQRYRDTPQAKAALLRAWGYTENADGTWSLETSEVIKNYTTDQAYNTIGGNNLALAKEKLAAAYEKLTSDPTTYGYDNTKKIKIIIGTSTASESWMRTYNYFVDIVWGNLVDGSPLKDIVEFSYAEKGSSWATAQRTGETQLFLGGGLGGNPLNPFDIIGAYIDPTDMLNFHPYWTETTSESLTIKLPADVDYSKTGWTPSANNELTMTPYNWYTCLNALAEKDAKSNVKYNFGEGVVDSSVRLTILASLEELIIAKCYSIPSSSQISASMLGAQFSYLQTDDYNVFMGFGGVRYMRSNYTDVQWNNYVKSTNGGDLTNEYLKTE